MKELKRGPKPKNALLKKMPCAYRLPQWLLDWMATQEDSRAVLIEKALIRTYKLKPPVVEQDHD